MKGIHAATIAIAIVLLAGFCNVPALEAAENSPPQSVSEQTTAPDAFGYLGGLLEARFYEPHATTDEPREEIRQAAQLYGIDLPMMLSIAKVESDFNPRVRTGSYKGLFQLSDYEFAKYGDGSIWDARDNARAAAHMFLVQAEKFKWALGHFPDYAERYMVHQQGIDGAIEHYEHPERVAWQSMCATTEGVTKGENWCKRCIWGNLLPQWKRFFGSVEQISSGDFVKVWTGRINLLANRYADAEEPNSTGSIDSTGATSSAGSTSVTSSTTLMSSTNSTASSKAKMHLRGIARRSISLVRRAAGRPSRATLASATVAASAGASASASASASAKPSSLANISHLVSRAFSPANGAATAAKPSPVVATAGAERRRAGGINLRRPQRQASAVSR
jgi:Transglycosylase SLT domain